ncbi:MAG: hypothetical protein FLDDKLPJ_02682 [Phycisphaerae bacterium]|nr:hypothetical protein [Phycisphaerae bacterium]
MTRRGPQTGAFTLLELLVVISIIALLISILLPALRNARDQGHRALCASHHRQLMTAALLYAQDYNDFLPPPNWAAMDPVPGWLYQSPVEFHPEHRRTGLVWPYFQVDRVYRCPKHPDPYFQTENLTSYLMNGAVAGFGRANGSFQTTRFRTEALIFWEAGEPTWNDGSSFPTEGLTTRHGGGSTLAGIDGHTEWMTHGEYQKELLRREKGRLWCAPDRQNGR